MLVGRFSLSGALPRSAAGGGIVEGCRAACQLHVNSPVPTAPKRVVWKPTDGAGFAGAWSKRPPRNQGIGDGYLASNLAAETSLVTCANISPTTAITSRDSKPLFRSSR